MNWRGLWLLGGLALGLAAQTNRYAPSPWAASEPPLLGPATSAAAPGAAAATPVAGDLVRLSWNQSFAWDAYSGANTVRRDRDWQLGPQVEWWAGGRRWQWSFAYAPWWWRFARQPGRNWFNQTLNASAGLELRAQDWLRGSLGWLRRDGGEGSGAAMGSGLGTAGPQAGEVQLGGRLEWLHAASSRSWWQTYLALGNRHYDFNPQLEISPVRHRSREAGVQYSRRFRPRWSWRARGFLRQQEQWGRSRVRLLAGWGELSWQPAPYWRLSVFAGPERAVIAVMPRGSKVSWLGAAGGQVTYRGEWRLEAQFMQQESSAAGLLSVPGMSRWAEWRLGRDLGRNWRWSWQAAVADTLGLNLAGPRERLFSAWTGPALARRLRRGLWLRFQASRLWQQHRGGRRLGLNQDRSRLALSLHYQLPHWGWEQ